MTHYRFLPARPGLSQEPAPSPGRAFRRTDFSSVPVKEMAAPTRSAVSCAPGEVENAALLDMPFPEFARTVARMLETLGYANVQAMKAMHGHGKGRNAHGGYDLRMFTPTRLARGLVIAQVKQYRSSVPRSFVDELRGTMLRLGATQGLLITTGTFSASAVEAAQSAQHAAPVRLVDGQELARLLRTRPETPAMPPTPAPSHDLPRSGMRPISRQESDRLEREFLAGLGAPPRGRVQANMPVLPNPENATLTLEIALRLAPVPSGDREADVKERK
jgi:hypothetical protein